MTKILTVIGARPQFIKAATVSRAIRNSAQGEMTEVLVHTGQHYDFNMSKVFFDELDIPSPNYNLGISGLTHGVMTGRMLEAIEALLLEEKPDCVLVYGDTNSTLAGALAAAKLHIPIAHVEAGLRSFNMGMPEEINRIVTDRVSSLLFCPTETAVRNLASEGIAKGVQNTGDVMYDAAIFYGRQAKVKSRVFDKLGVSERGYALATCHREENTDNPDNIREIISALASISSLMPVILPLHPRTRKRLTEHGLDSELRQVRVIDPLPYLDMVALEQSARVILTDSGGVQKEAYFFGVPCITMREETEWVETVESGWNCLVGARASRILAAIGALENGKSPQECPAFYGAGKAAESIVDALRAI